MVEGAQALAENAEKLASFPEVAFRVDEVLADDKSSASDIGALIEPDPALSAALLRIANSAAYGFYGPVDSVETAVRVVGSREVRDLTYAISATETFKGVPNELVTVEDFWRHSLYCGVAAQYLAKSARVCHGTSLFTAGLLHDIGQLVMFNQCPDLSKEALLRSLDLEDGRATWLAEREVFGFDHMAVGAELANCWNFPDALCEAIAWHHTPFQSNTPSDVATVVHVANSIAVLAELDSDNLDDAPAINERATEKLGVTAETLVEMIESTQEAGAELLSLFVD